jgi:hypothetical protein
MRFFDYVPQVIALLQRDGRISYRALQYEFGFDMAFSEVLREELQFRGIAHDKDGRELVLAGSPSSVAPSPTVLRPHGAGIESPMLATAAAPLLPPWSRHPPWYLSRWITANRSCD